MRRNGHKPANIGEEIQNFLGRSPFQFGKDVLGGYIRYTFFHKNPPLPRFLVLFTTYYCEARCIMCGIWKPNEKNKHELTPEQFQHILSDPLFREIDYLHLDGGETTLIKGRMLDITERALQVLPKVKKASVVTHGMNTERTVRTCIQLHELCVENNVHLHITVSLHGYGESQDITRGVRGGFERATETIRQLRKLQDEHGFYLSINSVITPVNVYDAPKVLEWCQQQDVPVRFVVNEKRERFLNLDMEEAMTFTDEQNQFILDFIQQLASEKSLMNYAAYRYSKLFDFLSGKERDLACRYDLGGVMLGSNGELYYCSHSKEIGNCIERTPSEIYFDPANVQYRQEELLDKECKQCPPYASQELEFYKEFPRYLGFLMKR